MSHPRREYISRWQRRARTGPPPAPGVIDQILRDAYAPVLADLMQSSPLMHMLQMSNREGFDYVEAARVRRQADLAALGRRRARFHAHGGAA